MCAEPGWDQSAGIAVRASPDGDVPHSPTPGLLRASKPGHMSSALLRAYMSPFQPAVHSSRRKIGTTGTLRSTFTISSPRSSSFSSLVFHKSRQVRALDFHHLKSVSSLNRGPLAVVYSYRRLFHTSLVMSQPKRLIVACDGQCIVPDNVS